jgi:hypothetical protein
MKQLENKNEMELEPASSSPGVLVLDAPERQDRLTKKDSPRYQINPFMGDVVVKRGSKKITVGSAGALVNTDTGEVNATEISVIRQVDRTEFVKLFADGVKRFFELSPAGAKLLSYVLAVVQQAPGTDRINLHFMDYMERFPGEPKPMSKTTFFRGFTELLTKGFIAQSTVPNVYFINPKLFFNGDRARFVMEYRKSEEAKSHEVREQLDAITQEVMDAKVDKVLASDKVKKSLTRKILKA